MRLEPPPSIQQVCGKAFRTALRKVPTEMWKMDEGELEELVHPTQRHFELRFFLWVAICSSMATGKKIKVLDIRGRLTGQRVFQLLRIPQTTVWLFSPWIHGATGVEALGDWMTDRAREVVDLPLEDAKGKTITKNVLILLKFLEILYDVVERSPYQDKILRA